MTPNDDRDRLIEAVTTAWRPLDPGQPRILPEWHDLDPTGRLEAFDAALELRKMEAALSPNRRSTTVEAVLARIRGG